jgi:Zn-finger nucleic acid-binding protein
MPKEIEILEKKMKEALTNFLQAEHAWNQCCYDLCLEIESQLKKKIKTKKGCFVFHPTVDNKCVVGWAYDTTSSPSMASNKSVQIEITKNKKYKIVWLSDQYEVDNTEEAIKKFVDISRKIIKIDKEAKKREKEYAKRKKQKAREIKTMEQLKRENQRLKRKLAKQEK